MRNSKKHATQFIFQKINKILQTVHNLHRFVPQYYLCNRNESNTRFFMRVLIPDSVTATHVKKLLRINHKKINANKKGNIKRMNDIWIRICVESIIMQFSSQIFDSDNPCNTNDTERAVTLTTYSCRSLLTLQGVQIMSEAPVLLRHIYTGQTATWLPRKCDFPVESPMAISSAQSSTKWNRPACITPSWHSWRNIYCDWFGSTGSANH